MKTIAVVVLATLYVLSPIDVIPDIAPIIGWLDDVGVIGWAYSTIKASTTVVGPKTD
jgi:uncharacterized membrane protein YkvA (DUF1232 family)